MRIGELVWDYALGKTGIVIDGAWTEKRDGGFPLPWEWLVLYEDGELIGADTSDLKGQSWK